MKKKLKGFTLMELIIVIAIMGVLIAVLIPAWNNWIYSAQVKRYNQTSKVVFNAAQTTALEYKFKERRLESADRQLDGDFVFYWNGKTGAVLDSSNKPVADGDLKDANINTNFARSVNSVLSSPDEVVYKVHIVNYMVQSVVAAHGDTNNHKGAYPKNLKGSNSGSIQTYDMSTIE